MANLGDIQQAPDGTYHELTGSGWKQVSEDEARLAVSSPANRFLLGAAGAGTSGYAGAMGNIIGTVTGLAGLTGMARSGARAVGTRMKDRVQGVAEEAAQQRRFTRDLGDVVRGDEPGLARRAAGSAADQAQAAVESIPGLRAIAAIPKERRAAEYNKIVVEALGGNQANLTRAGLIPRKEMDKVVAGIEKGFDDAFPHPDAIIDIGEKLATERQLVKSLPKAERIIFGEGIDQGEITARQFKSWYQEMNKLQASKGATEVQRKMARRIVEALDGIAEGSEVIDDAAWNEARKRWRVWLAVKSGKAYSKESINPASFRSALDRIYGDDARLVRTEGQLDEIAELIEAAAEIEGLGTAIPSSGTAERLLGAGALGGLGYMATQ